jgi:hypothetical protein
MRDSSVVGVSIVTIEGVRKDVRNSVSDITDWIDSCLGTAVGSPSDDDDDVYLYRLQTRVLKNLYHVFRYRPARKA